MVQQLFRENTTLFKDEDVFESDFTPDTIHSRDTQLRGLAETISPALRGARPVNTILRGPPGTGKTTCVRRIFGELTEAGHRHVVPVLINCQDVHSVTSVFHAIFEAVLGHQALIAGISLDRLTEHACAALIERKAVLIVCLDDADIIARSHLLNDVLRLLLRLHESHPGVRTGVVATMSTANIHLPAVLDPAVLSSYQPEEIRFPPYDGDDIRHILQDRVRMGLFSGVISPAILDRITAVTLDEGDLRMGITLLKVTVMHAEGRGHSSVQESDLQARLHKAHQVRISDIERALTPGERRLLAHIAMMQNDRPAAEFTSRPLYESFRKNEDISYSTFSRRLNRLADLRIVDLVRGRGPGNTRVVRLRFDAGVVLDLCG